ncbi:MFS transporter [Ornithinibacillus halophilus]|uniref:Predicted arabinose efflux permease, MFS family n=1 Tax=Ornithinibacillus halophilus TaxID=930117 RepID=A0A1M5IH87_9BACI|nr:MFS transporter [Ornithinibacillus halophilus]SHG27615.1 Predicted arabinose efflux permease, MFS family [Ornithinibacillus halophilus]
MSNHKVPIWTKSFISISLTQFIVFVAFYALLTTLPNYVIRNLGGTEAQGGLVVTSMLVAAIIMRLFSGTLLEKMGKQKSLIWSTILFSLTMFLYIWVDGFIPLLIVRFIHGISFGFLTTATSAIAADLVPDERRGEGLGYFAMSMNIAIVIGPFLGLSLIQVASPQLLFIVLSFIMVGGVFLAFLVNVPNVAVQVNAIKRKFSIHDLLEFKAFPIAIIGSLVGIAYSSILSFISVYATEIDLAHVANYFFIVFAAVMIISRPSLGQLFDVKGPKYVIFPCVFIFAAGLVMLSFTNTAWMFLVSAVLIGLGSGSLLPSFQTMCIQAADKHRSGHATSTFFIFWDSGIALGSYLLGMIVAHYSFQALYMTAAATLIVVIGLFMIQQSWQGKKIKFERVPTESGNQVG